MRKTSCSFSSSDFKLQNFYYELKLFSNFDIAAKRALNVHEGLEYLEDLEVSSSDESDSEDEFVSEGKLVIVPPSNVEGRETDEISGEENGKDPNNVNKNQLLSNAHVELYNSLGNVSVGITDSSVNKPTIKRKQKIQANKQRKR